MTSSKKTHDISHTENTFGKRYIQFIQQYRWAVFIVSLVLFGFSLWYTATNIRLNNDLSSLLPQNTPSVLALEESTERFGSSDKFILAIQSDDPVLIARLQDSLKQKVELEWKDIAISVQVQRDNQFFLDHALLYLPVPHLERVVDNLYTIKGRISQEANPLLVQLSEAEDEDEDEELVWFESDISQELGLPDEAASAFQKFFDENKEDGATAQEIEAEWDPKAILPDSLKDRLIGQKESDRTVNGVVLIKLVESSTNLNFTQEVLARAEKLLAPFRSGEYSSPVRFSVEGSYEGLKDVKGMRSDGIISTIVSVILVVLLVVYLFRSFWGAVLLMGQVFFATSLMLLFTTVFYKQLNPYTLFVAAIIIGMGIDFSIHLMGTAQRLRSHYNSLEDSLAATIQHLLKPMALAAFTTIAGLLTLLVADFRGFYEFGVIASVGIFFSFGSALFGLPVLILLVGGLPEKRNQSMFPSHWQDKDVARLLKRAAVTLAVVLCGAVLCIPQAEFEYNFRNLRPDKKAVESNEPKMHYGVAMKSKRKSSQPAVVLGNSQEELNQLYDTLMVRLHEEKDPYLKSFLTLKTFVPPEEDQEERMEYIGEIQELIGNKAFDYVEGDNATKVAQLRELSEVEPFTPEDIPEWALDVLKEKDGSYGNIGFIYGKYKSWDMRDVKEFQDRYGQWAFGENKLRVYSTAFITSDIVQAVKTDSYKMGGLISLILVTVLGISLRNFRLLAVSVLSIGGSIILTIGFLGAGSSLFQTFDISYFNGKINIFNVIVIPMVLGVGIDATIHLLIAFVRDREKGLRYIFDTTGQMVTAASVTTVCGFVGLLFVNHRGMRSIGELAIVAIFAAYVTAMIVTPYLCSKFLKKE
jgi:predicted RND superfamily exporter protein